MDFKWLRPAWLNVIITVIVLSLPLLKENVQLQGGGFVVERYQPIVLLGIYIWTLDWKPILLMLGFTLLMYLIVSVIVLLATRIYGRFKK